MPRLSTQHQGRSRIQAVLCGACRLRRAYKGTFAGKHDDFMGNEVAEKP